MAMSGLWPTIVDVCSVRSGSVVRQFRVVAICNAA